MYRLIFLLLFVLQISCSAQETNSVVVKYMPLSMETPVNFLEEDFNTLSNVNNVVQVRFDTIINDSVYNVIVNKLKQIKEDNNTLTNQQHYDLRMQCKIISNNNEVDSFYVNSQRILVYNKNVYSDQSDIVDLIFGNLCRPVYSYIFLKENEYWNNSLNCCCDSIEFISVYGQGMYDKAKVFFGKQMKNCLLDQNK